MLVDKVAVCSLQDARVRREGVELGSVEMPSSQRGDTQLTTWRCSPHLCGPGPTVPPRRSGGAYEHIFDPVWRPLETTETNAVQRRKGTW